MRVQCTCARCGASFTVVPAQVKRGRGKHCSRACADAARRERLPRVCAECGTVDLVKPSKSGRPYCSLACRGAASMTPLSEATCQQCGIRFTLATWRVLKGEGQYCGRPCRNLGVAAALVASGRLAGENHPRWTGGYEPYYGPSWRRAQHAARLRDRICQECGVSANKNGMPLDVHHIAPFRTFGRERHAEANDLANLVVLCRTCHLKLEWATHWRHSE